MKFNLISLLAIALFLLPTLLLAQSPLASHYNEAKLAYEKKDYKGYLFHTQKADSISPNHPTLTYNLASAYSLTGKTEQGIIYLKKAILMNTNLFPKDDPDFEVLKKTPSFQEARTLNNTLLKNVTQSEVAFTNGEKDLHPESIVYNPDTKSFLMSSVHKNKIVSYNTQTGKTSDWKKSNEDGLWAVMGMKRDAKRKVLWVCTVATKEMNGYEDSLEGKTALLKYDLKTKKLLKRYDLEGGHWLGDLVLDNAGTPFISDSMKPIIYTIENDQLVVLNDFTDELFNLQGLAFDTDQNKLFIADYKLGLFTYDLGSSNLTNMTSPDHITTKGIDGLYQYHGKLIAIHNGVKPFRICEYTINDTETEITDIKYIDRGRSELGEPTLGVITRGAFYYIANSPWGKYDRQGNLKQEDLTDNIVLKYELRD